jgi:hypothetical protein
MKEKEKIYTAKLYLEKLANGRNPLDGSALPEEDILNNVTLCRTFIYVADLLEQILENGGLVGKVPNAKKAPFSISEEERMEIDITEKPVGVSQLADRINAVLDPHVKSLPVAQITKWLEAEGLLRTEIQNQERVKYATEEGNALGILTEERISHTGHRYRKNFYDAAAQAYVIANLEQIATFAG